MNSAWNGNGEDLNLDLLRCRRVTQNIRLLLYIAIHQHDPRRTKVRNIYRSIFSQYNLDIYLI